MVGEGGCGQAHVGHKVADVQSIMPRAHKQPENGKAGVVAKGGQGAGVKGQIAFHTPRYNQNSRYDQASPVDVPGLNHNDTLNKAMPSQTCGAACKPPKPGIVRPLASSLRKIC